MKKLSLVLLLSILFSLFVSYVFLNKSAGSREAFEQDYNNAIDAGNTNVVNLRAEQEAFEYSTSATLKLDNDTESDVVVKVIRVSDNSEYYVFVLPKGSVKQANIRSDKYYLKMKYNEGKKFAYQRGDEFTIDDGSQTTITLKKTIFGNYGSSSMSGSDF